MKRQIFSLTCGWCLKTALCQGIDLETGVLVDVIKDKDITGYMKQHFNEDIYIDRTTENSIAGYLHGEIKRKKLSNKNGQTSI